MSRALVTFAAGEQSVLTELSFPPMREYAERHGYDFISRVPSMMIRPPSWHKVRVLLNALDAYEEALWVDADVLMLDTSRDFADEVRLDAWQGVTLHHTREGSVPSVGVWLVRQQMREVLEQQWRLDRYRHHPWWEQAAMLDLLGYEHETKPVRLRSATDLYARTHFLDGVEWNQLYLEVPWGTSNDLDRGVRFVHVGPGSRTQWRLDAMRDIARAQRAQEGATQHA